MLDKSLNFRFWYSLGDLDKVIVKNGDGKYDIPEGLQVTLNSISTQKDLCSLLSEERHSIMQSYRRLILNSSLGSHNPQTLFCFFWQCNQLVQRKGTNQSFIKKTGLGLFNKWLIFTIFLPNLHLSKTENNK